MPREKHPIHAVAKRAGQLNKVLTAIIGEERPSRDARPSTSFLWWDLAKATPQLSRLAARAFVVYQNTGSVSWLSHDMMRRSFRTIRDCIEGLKGPQLMGGEKPRKMSRRLERLGQLVRELGGAINTLGNAIEKRRVLVHQANSSLEDFEKVRKAWGGLVKKSEAGPTVAEVERAINLVGEVYLQDSKMLKKFVRLILALRTTQELEMRYRSTAPGRPWVYMTGTTVFPDPETIQAIRDNYEWPGAIYVVATQPSWRIIWIID